MKLGGETIINYFTDEFENEYMLTWSNWEYWFDIFVEMKWNSNPIIILILLKHIWKSLKRSNDITEDRKRLNNFK